MGYDEIFVKERGPTLIDDHRPFLNRGISAVDIIDFTYPEHHEEIDDLDHVSAENIAIVADVVLKWILTRLENDVEITITEQSTTLTTSETTSTQSNSETSTAESTTPATHPLARSVIGSNRDPKRPTSSVILPIMCTPLYTATVPGTTPSREPAFSLSNPPARPGLLPVTCAIIGVTETPR